MKVGRGTGWMTSSPKLGFGRFGAGLAVAVALASYVTVAGAAEPMHTGGLTSQPIGHFEFCKSHPAECAVVSVDSGPEHMTGKLWREIASVNLAVNTSVKPMSDFDIYGKDEVWAYPHGVGDCEDYVLEKRRILLASGIPVSDLLITVVRKPDGEGHAVLTVRTDKGDFVLDNLSDTVRQWYETGYRFLKRQATDNTGHWVSIREGESTMVAAVK
jgi:predicted transglutaminase-like cysteine proteinase